MGAGVEVVLEEQVLYSGAGLIGKSHLKSDEAAELLLQTTFRPTRLTGPADFGCSAIGASDAPHRPLCGSFNKQHL
jgi:hypothetical protein